MKLLLKDLRVIGSNDVSGENPADILVENGVITRIGQSIKESGAKEWSSPGAYVSAGWIDMKANFRDPGHEHKEDLRSGLEAAAQGGFTAVVLMSSTDPPIQSKADIRYLTERANGHIVEVYPTGVLSEAGQGKEISEMFDMKQAGAVAFTDDRKSVADSGLLLRALQYAGNMNSLVITYADDAGISGRGIVNEGPSSTLAGLKGAPDFAEALMVNRDIRICEYAGGRLHFSTISTEAAVNLIRQAKQQGIGITAEVCAHQLFFDDSSVLAYDTLYKVKPPFRSRKDIKALVNGLKDGTIDAIVSDHSPHEKESKVVEFDFAAFGIGGIETTFAVANTACGDVLGLQRLIETFTIGPRNILGLPVPEIREGMAANLTIFDPEMEWTPDAAGSRSRSRNNPFFGIKLKGKPLAVFNKGQFRVI
jgi:dihydroorotase